MSTSGGRTSLREVALDDFFGFCDGLSVLRGDNRPILISGWREAVHQTPSYKPMLNVLRSALDVLKTAMGAEAKLRERLGRPTPGQTPQSSSEDESRSLSESPKPRNPITPVASTRTSQLGAAGRHTATLFKACKAQACHRFTKDAGIIEAVKLVGWHTALVAANLAAWCEGQEYAEFWTHGGEAMGRVSLFSEWEREAGKEASRAKEAIGALRTAVLMFVKRYEVQIE